MVVGSVTTVEVAAAARVKAARATKKTEAAIV